MVATAGTNTARKVTPLTNLTFTLQKKDHLVFNFLISEHITDTVQF